MTSPRFRFGDNWQRFVETLREEHVEQSTLGLARSLGTNSLVGRTFLDIGSGSGLHSMAALRLGAHRIVSFDHDPGSVACTRELWRRAGSPSSWTIHQGSILDPSFMATLPRCDDVYSWGVLHHTGDMWTAIRNAAARCRSAGSRFLIGIYNEKRPGTDVMRWIKRAYVQGGPWAQKGLVGSYWVITAAVQTLRGRSVRREMQDRQAERGMDYWRDLEDWVGGYPYECATPQAVQDFVGPLGFRLEAQSVRNTIANVNEFRFVKTGIK